MKKVITAAMSLLMTVSLVGCASASSTPAPSSAPTAAIAASTSTTASAPAASGEAAKVGVIQLAPHPALDACYEGFVDALAEGGYVEGENLTLDVQNAQGELSNCPTIASKLANDKNDLIFAIATPAAQAMANETKEIPIVATAVTDFVEAKLVASNEAPGGNLTGTSDLTPVKEQLALLTQLAPEVKTVGFLYNSSEANSIVQIETAKAVAEELGLAYEEFTVSNTNEIQSVVTAMLGKVDAIYSPTDNMIATAVATVATLASDSKIPYICGEEALVEGGALATVSVSYYDLGRMAGEQAVQILKGEGLPAEMPIQFQAIEDAKTVMNQATADALGIAVPAGMDVV